MSRNVRLWPLLTGTQRYEKVVSTRNRGHGHFIDAPILAYLIDHVVKLVVDRGRPPAYLSDVLFHAYPTDPRGTGYPSSHTAVTVAVVVGAWP